MNYKTIFTALGLISAAMGCSAIQAQEQEPVQASIRTYFSPNGGAQEAIVKELAQAKKSVRMQAYLLNNPHITDALVQAKNRGVDVKVIVDKKVETSKKDHAGILARGGIPVKVDDQHPSAHNKTIVIDGKTTIAGSYNFVDKAENRNAENLLIIDSPEIARRYTEDWEKHNAHARELQPRRSETI